jgi:hypothetical protein
MEDETIFKIEPNLKIPELPDIKERAKINIKYPLIAPYAYAHIFWDFSQEELVYHVEEPELNDTEKEILRLIMLALEEMINISIVKVEKISQIIKYLEKNVQSILVELGTKVSKETYLKLMYYIFRNSVGLNRIILRILNATASVFPYILSIENMRILGQMSCSLKCRN